MKLYILGKILKRCAGDCGCWVKVNDAKREILTKKFVKEFVKKDYTIVSVLPGD